jgi:hypothetical protein
MRDSPCRQKKITFAATTLRAKGAGNVHWTFPFESLLEQKKKHHIPAEYDAFSLARDEGFALSGKTKNSFTTATPP